MRKLFTYIMILMLFSWCQGQISACTTPVFQYALQRWHGDPYRISVSCKKGTASGAIRALRKLETISAITLSITGTRQATPRLIVKYPSESQIETVICSEPLSADAVKRISDSPIRRKIARKLLDGDAYVWLLLKCGDEKKDESAATLLEKELKKRSEFSFSIIPISRSDTSEKFLIQMLTGLNPTLKHHADEPIAFPMFGRARILLALVGEKITPKNIRGACDFMTGPCACEIKIMNPGVDMLMNIDWDASLSNSPQFVEQTLPPAELSVFRKATSQPKVKPKLQSRPQPKAMSADVSSGPIIVTVSAILLVIVLASVVIYRGKGR